MKGTRVCFVPPNVRANLETTACHKAHATDNALWRGLCGMPLALRLSEGLGVTSKLHEPYAIAVDTYERLRRRK
jgi:hypothetical protein